MDHLQCQRHLFDLSPDITYLNCAYLSPLLNSSITEGIKGMRRKSRPNEVAKEDFFEPLEELKLAFAGLIDCENPQRIALQPSASYGIGTVVKNLRPKKNGNIVLLHEQFPSNVYGYRDFADRHDVEIRTVRPAEPGLTVHRWNEGILSAIDDDTICVSCPHIHWSDGSIIDLKMIRQKTLEHSALLIVDGTQSVGAMPFSVSDVRPDALICAAYKFLLGPYTTCLSYYGPAFDDGSPLEYNWITREQSDHFANLVEYQDAFRPFAFRYNMGECSNFIMIPMLLESIRQLVRWNPARIQTYCQDIVRPFLDAIKEKGYEFVESERANHLFGIYLSEDSDPKIITEALEKQKIFVSFRGKAIRISPYLYNEQSDLDRLLQCL